MKSIFVSLKKRQDGFTLVELMVVVAIIGLLSAVAIPNFKKYQAKAKTSEAKLQLSAIYTAEQSFFSDYSIYANCLRYMGYDPSGEAASRYFLMGFPGLTAGITNGAGSAYESAVNSGLNNAAFVAGTPITMAGTPVAQGGSGGCPDNGASIDGQTFFVAAKRTGNEVALVGDIGTGLNTMVLGTAATANSSRDPNALVAGLGNQQLGAASGVGATQVFRAVALGVIDAGNNNAVAAAGNRQMALFLINQDKQVLNPRTGY